VSGEKIVDLADGDFLADDIWDEVAKMNSSVFFLLSSLLMAIDACDCRSKAASVRMGDNWSSSSEEMH
jgi:hypothetical protein